MISVRLTSPSGELHEVVGRPGSSLMETAVKHGVPGIVAECGGACSCATCHVYVDEEFATQVGGADDWEDEMLEEAVAPRRPTSRLSCQIKLSEELDGLSVTIAPEQE
ncbi:2Fe-2S iron-sulfur cluster-binding protein [Janibacter terrae]|uniref:2Fe-2S iron-sulfur cluster-binding protein n=1 Tax=Janibacter terrae TaxID=103817 RepID=A0ABZ2FKE3_9MICO